VPKLIRYLESHSAPVSHEQRWTVAVAGGWAALASADESLQPADTEISVNVPVIASSCHLEPRARR